MKKKIILVVILCMIMFTAFGCSHKSSDDETTESLETLAGETSGEDLLATKEEETTESEAVAAIKNLKEQYGEEFETSVDDNGNVIAIVPETNNAGEKVTDASGEAVTKAEVVTTADGNNIKIKDVEAINEETTTAKVTKKDSTKETTEAPTTKPTQKTTEAPTTKPTQKATEAPTTKPTQKATEAPTEAPTKAATTIPATINGVTYPSTKKVNGVTYAIYSSYAEIVDYDDSVSGTLTCESYVNGVPVTVINENYNPLFGKKYTGLVLPEKLKKIDYIACCNNLKSIKMYNNVTEIQDSAFSYNPALTSINISTSVSYLGACMFSGCTSLKAVTIPASVKRIDLNIFENTSGLTVTFNNTSNDVQASCYGANCVVYWVNMHELYEGPNLLVGTNLILKFSNETLK